MSSLSSPPGPGLAALADPRCAGKISPELGGASEKVNVLVDLPFPPERFHVLVFQTYGRVSGTEDNAIELRGVKRTDLTPSPGLTG